MKHACEISEMYVTFSLESLKRGEQFGDPEVDIFFKWSLRK
jgi:hypothetical protein